MIKKYGAVSKQVAQEMARNVKKLSQTDFGIGISGIAGPSGGTVQKPVGTVFIAIASKKSTLCKKNLFTGMRAEIREKAAKKALNLLKPLLSP